MKIQQFQGGLATRLEPQFIGQNQAQVYENIDNSKGALVPLKGTAPSGIIVERYQTYYNAENQWVSSSEPRDYIEYQGTLYWTDRVTVPQKFDGTTVSNLGITPPDQLTDFAISELDNIVDLTVDGDTVGTGLPNEDTTYRFVNSDGINQSNILEIVVDTRQIVTTSQKNFVVSAGDGGSQIATKTVVHTTVPTTRDIVIKNPVGITIGSAGVEIYRLYEGEFYFVATLLTDTSSFTDAVHDISGNKILDIGLFEPLQGMYQYVLTYYNSSTGTESGPSIVSEELDLTEGGAITINNVPISSDPQVDKKRLYRIGGDLTAFTLVTEVDNAITTIIDLADDTEVQGTLLLSSIALEAPTGLAFLVENYAMLFGAIGSNLRFTPIGEPESWPATYFLAFENPITGIAPVANGLLVFSTFRTYLVTGTGPTSLSQQLLTADQGCLAFESVKSISGAALWFSSDGLCTSSGNAVQVVSKDMLGKISLDIVDSVVFDEAYYGLQSNGKIFVFDYAYDRVYKQLDFDVLSLVIANDTLYGWLDGEMQEFYASSANSTIKYKSPRYTEGSMTEQKTYKNIYIYHKGDIIVNVYVDEELVATKQLTGTDSTQVKTSAESQRGFFIEFEFEGTGEVHEIEYVAGGKKRG